MDDIKEKSAECEYCNLVSGEEKDIGEGKWLILYMERHNNTFSIKAIGHSDSDELDINYCPMCRQKVGVDMLKIKKGDKIIDIWGNEKTIINTDCGSNICGKLYEYEDGKYIVEGNIDRVVKGQKKCNKWQFILKKQCKKWQSCKNVKKYLKKVGKM